MTFGNRFTTAMQGRPRRLGRRRNGLCRVDQCLLIAVPFRKRRGWQRQYLVEVGEFQAALPEFECVAKYRVTVGSFFVDVAD